MCVNASCCCCELLEELRSARQDDAVWILTSSFIIFTMQSGFGLLESGCVSTLSNVNVMAKNVIDVICGGLAYWSIGFGLSFGSSSWSNAFIGFGDFFYDPDSWSDESADTGWGYARFMLQLSFATTAATIVSGAMVERTRLRSYIIFSMLLVLVEALPAHWVWAPEGFLHQLQVIDIAGGSVVHLVGGTAGLVATLMLKPRYKRWASGKREMSSPTNALLGTFILWWGWLGFNCGSTLGVTRGRWKLAARSAVATIQSSIGGGAKHRKVASRRHRKRQNSGQFFVDPVRVRRVWKGYITKKDRQEEFFVRMFDLLINRNPQIASVFLQCDDFETLTNEEAHFVLTQLAENIADFFEDLLDEKENILANEKQFTSLCFDCGMRHAVYTGKNFQPSFWDVFVHAMIETLRDSKAVSPKDIHAWHCLMRKIVRHLKEGYEVGIQENRAGLVMNQDGDVM